MRHYGDREGLSGLRFYVDRVSWEDTNLGRRLTPLGSIDLAPECWVWTSARRYHAMGKRKVFGLYVRNFWSEILRHHPADHEHLDVRA
jgi:hypothetical protein